MWPDLGSANGKGKSVGESTKRQPPDPRGQLDAERHLDKGARDELVCVDPTIEEATADAGTNGAEAQGMDLAPTGCS